MSIERTPFQQAVLDDMKQHDTKIQPGSIIELFSSPVFEAKIVGNKVTTVKKVEK